MNIKSLLSSWLGLGLLIFAMQYPFQYLFKLIGMAEMQSLAVALAALTATMIFTYYVYPHIIDPLFKIYAILFAFFASLGLAALYILSNATLRTAFTTMLQELFQSFDSSTILITVAGMILGLIIQLGLWYLFITMGNKQMVKALEAKK